MASTIRLRRSLSILAFAPFLVAACDTASPGPADIPTPDPVPPVPAFAASRAGTYRGTVTVTSNGEPRNVGDVTVTLTDLGSGRATLALDDRSDFGSGAVLRFEGVYSAAGARFVARETPSDSVVLVVDAAGALTGTSTRISVPLTGTFVPGRFEMGYTRRTLVIGAPTQTTVFAYAATRP